MKEVYLCADYLKSHPLFSIFGSDLESLARKDYPGKGYFRGKDIPSIDLDEFERHKKGSNDCTSDGVVGIAEVGESRLSNRRLLLTELRMDYENQKNLGFSNIRSKYLHSIEILRFFDPESRIDSEFALIFSDKVEPKAKRWFKSWSRESSKKEAANWITYTPESFCNHINYGKELPLTPSDETIAFVSYACSRINIRYDEFMILTEKIEYYWKKLKDRHMLVDLKYMADRIVSFLPIMKFPIGEEGDLCGLQRKSIEEKLRI